MSIAFDFLLRPYVERNFRRGEKPQRINRTLYGGSNASQSIVTSNYIYDNNGRIIELTHLNNSGTVADYEYQYDAANRVAEFASSDGVSVYNYDKTDQLTDADHDYQSDEDYTYDENGNRVNAGYVIGENNQLLSDGTYDYEYDAEGNRVKQTEISYDAFGGVTAESNSNVDFRLLFTGQELY